MTWDHDQIRSGRRKSTIPNDNEEGEKPPGESWRKCWICNVRVYQAQGKRRDDPPLTSGWASIDLAGGLIVRILLTLGLFILIELKHRDGITLTLRSGETSSTTYLIPKISYRILPSICLSLLASRHSANHHMLPRHRYTQDSRLRNRFITYHLSRTLSSFPHRLSHPIRICATCVTKLLTSCGSCMTGWKIRCENLSS